MAITKSLKSNKKIMNNKIGFPHPPPGILLPPLTSKPLRELKFGFDSNQLPMLISNLTHSNLAHHVQRWIK